MFRPEVGKPMICADDTSIVAVASTISLDVTIPQIELDDIVLMRRKSTGTLVNDALLPGKRLYLFSTGTGIAPFASLIRDPETYEKFKTIFLCHTCRNVIDLEYGQELVRSVKLDPLVGDLASKNLHHYQTIKCFMD